MYQTATNEDEWRSNVSKIANDMSGVVRGTFVQRRQRQKPLSFVTVIDTDASFRHKNTELSVPPHNTVSSRIHLDVSIKVNNADIIGASDAAHKKYMTITFDLARPTTVNVGNWDVSKEIREKGVMECCFSEWFRIWRTYGYKFAECAGIAPHDPHANYLDHATNSHAKGGMIGYVSSFTLTEPPNKKDVLFHNCMY